MNTITREMIDIEQQDALAQAKRALDQLCKSDNDLLLRAAVCGATTFPLDQVLAVCPHGELRADREGTFRYLTPADVILMILSPAFSCRIGANNIRFDGCMGVIEIDGTRKYALAFWLARHFAITHMPIRPIDGEPTVELPTNPTERVDQIIEAIFHTFQGITPLIEELLAITDELGWPQVVEDRSIKWILAQTARHGANVRDDNFMSVRSLEGVGLRKIDRRWIPIVVALTKRHEILSLDV